jgi:hypothetical protein
MIVKKDLSGLKRKCVVVCVFLVMMFLTFAARAQPGDPGDDDCGTSPDDECYVPLDTWVFVLVAIAFIYGMYYLHKKQKSLSA